jgi:CheY-like chemotaxis protein
MTVPSFLEKKLNLKSMTILVVDGNEFSRSFTRNLCKSFCFEKILGACDTKEALDQMCSTNVDIMLTDYILKPDSGSGFVRRVRTMEGVRNPFLPIIVLTAMSDAETAAAALNAGANEFLARPFTLQQLLGRFVRVLLSPRSFIKSPDYVGPDRRRQQREFSGPERRAGANAKKMRPASVAATVAKANSPGGMTIRELEAEGTKVIAAEEKRYSAVRHQDLIRLTQLLDKLRQPAAPDPETVEQIYLISHDLKGMGQTFGYPLLTEAGTSLCRMLWKLPVERTVAAATIQGVEAHVRTMNLIVAQEIKHDGGKTGAELIQGLNALVERAMGRAMPTATASAG